jgi:hypothetical protein
MSIKYSHKLTIQDFKKFPVWEFTARHETIGPDGELVVVPITDLPVSSLERRFVGTEVTLANGCRLMAVLLGINLVSAKPISEMIVYRVDETFMFRRSAPRASGPEQLAQFLCLRLEDIFPISYDISQLATGDPCAIKGEILVGMPNADEGVRDKEYFKGLLKERKRASRPPGVFPK